MTTYVTRPAPEDPEGTTYVPTGLLDADGLELRRKEPPPPAKTPIGFHW